MKKSTATSKQSVRTQNAISELGDPLGMAMSDGIQVIGSPEAFASGKEPRMREMTIDDVEDDCPVCMLYRDRILAGNPPMVMVFE